MDGLEERWKQLKLSMEEEIDIVVDEETLLEELRKGENSTIAKIHIDRHINQEVLNSTMSKVWKTTKPFTVREIHRLTALSSHLKT